MTSLKPKIVSQESIQCSTALLNAVFHDIQGGDIFTSSINSESKGFSFKPFSKLCNSSHDNSFYYCTMSVKPPEDGGLLRRKSSNFNAFHVIVLDDIGTKAEPNGVTPSYIIESSPGNYQWGYILEHAITDIDEANRIMRSICKSNKMLTDPACNSANRMVRLPMGTNGKPGVDWDVKLKYFDETALFDPYLLLVEWDVKLLSSATMSSGRQGALKEGITADEALESDEVYQWLLHNGHILSEINSSGFCEVTCPRGDEHSVDSPAYYSPIGYGGNVSKRFFKCFHSHESGGGAPDTEEFLAWVSVEGGPTCGVVGNSNVVSVVQQEIAYNDKGVPLRTVQNCILMVEELGYKFSYDEMLDKILMNGSAFKDVDVITIGIEIGNVYGCYFNNNMLFDAVSKMADDNKFHSVQDYLKKCEDTWDRVEGRAESVFIRYLNVEDTAINRQFSRKWLLGCISRALNPGCKFDNALLLTGAEGIGKSSIFKILARNWFGELTTLRDRESVENLRGVWICEFGEMNIATKHSQSELKQYMSRTHDRYRPAYGRVTVDYPRMVAYCGTSNHEKVLDDTSGTGNRRFWPMTCHRQRLDCFDWEALESEVDLIWGEVISWYRAGEKCVIDKCFNADMTTAQLNATKDDDWEGLIYEWLDKRISADTKTGGKGLRCVGRLHIAVECLGISPDKYTRYHGNRIASIMDSHPDWEYNGNTPVYDVGYGRVKGWKYIGDLKKIANK